MDNRSNTQDVSRFGGRKFNPISLTVVCLAIEGIDQPGTTEIGSSATYFARTHSFELPPSPVDLTCSESAFHLAGLPLAPTPCSQQTCSADTKAGA